VRDRFACSLPASTATSRDYVWSPLRSSVVAAQASLQYDGQLAVAVCNVRRSLQRSCQRPQTLPICDLDRAVVCCFDRILTTIRLGAIIGPNRRKLRGCRELQTPCHIARWPERQQVRPP
jgi:hypothetical protein